MPMMDDIEKLMAKAAEENGVSPAEFRQAIELAIAQAMADPDPAVQARWRSIPCQGETPTPEELLLYLIEKMRLFGE